jgi:hypothetical protein
MSRRLSALLLVQCLALFVLAAGLARAQDARRTLLPPDGQEKFLEKYKAQKLVFSTINRPTEGEKASKDVKEHVEAIDMTAQFYTYRLTWLGVKDTPGEADKIMTDFRREVDSADGEAMRTNNPVFRELFLKALAVRARDVVQTQEPIAAVNAGRMLERLARAGIDEAGDACLAAVKNQNDFLEPRARLGVQYWAIQGLGDMLRRWAEDAAAAPAARKEREERYVEALVGVIEGSIGKTAATATGAAPVASDEVLGLQFFRREAVRSLGQYRVPAVTDEKGAIKIKSALTLLKVMNNDGFTPPVLLDERIEAAIGVAGLRSKAVPAYQPDYAAEAIGHVVVQMAAEARPNKGGENPSKFPWKVKAAHLADALEAMQTDTKGAPEKAGDYVQSMVGKAHRVLKDIEQTERALAGGDLQLWLSNNAPPHDTLYKGVADSTVRPFDRSDAAADRTDDKKPAGKPDQKKPDDKKPADKPDQKKPDDKKPGKP